MFFPLIFHVFSGPSSWTSFFGLFTRSSAKVGDFAPPQDVAETATAAPGLCPAEQVAEAQRLAREWDTAPPREP